MTKQGSIKKPGFVFRKKHLPFLIVFIATILAAGLFLYRDYSIRADKNRFEQAHKSIDVLYSDIVAKVGQPDNVKQDQSCGYASRKFSRGPLSCAVGINFAYVIPNADEATNLAKTINDAVSRKNNVFTTSYSNAGSILPFVSLQGLRDYQEIKNDLTEKSSQKRCYLTVVYALSSSIYHPLSVSSEKSDRELSIQLGCKDSAKAEYYPLTN